MLTDFTYLLQMELMIQLQVPFWLFFISMADIVTFDHLLLIVRMASNTFFSSLVVRWLAVGPTLL